MLGECCKREQGERISIGTEQEASFEVLGSEGKDSAAADMKNEIIYSGGSPDSSYELRSGSMMGKSCSTLL